MKVSILAIGTELTTGQIANSNAAWLSERLTDLEAEVVLHETVADDRPAIRDALDRCSERSGLIFVMGGLGPTTDDFTREIIAEWLGQPLIFDEASWKHIVGRLSAFGVPLVESQRQQCQYPKGAEIFTNLVGTANGFFVSRGETAVWVLPGPPREIAWLWDNGIEAHFKARLLSSGDPTRPSQKTRLLRWSCLGRSEAELGETTEAALSGSGLKTGYRFQRPYVEVKVWCPESRLAEAQPWLSKLEQALGQSVVTKDGGDLGEEFLRAIQLGSEIEIFDSATGGMLAERLGRLLREPRYEELATSICLNTEWVVPQAPSEWVTAMISGASLGAPGATDDASGDSETLVLAVGGFTSSGQWAVGMKFDDRIHHELLTLPFRKIDSTEMLERARRYATEVALRQWMTWLRQAFS